MNHVGDKLDWFLQLEAEGADVPVLKNRPELYQDLLPFWNAFQDLSGSRQNTGFGIGLIPYSEITNYLNENQILSYPERYEYIRWIQYIDREFVRMKNEKAQQEIKKKK